MDDRALSERIVSDALEANVDLLVDGGEEMRAIGRLKAYLDRSIGSEPARSISIDAIEP